MSEKCTHIAGGGQCGLLNLRQERPYEGMAPMPEDGSCGVDPKGCPRLVPNNPLGVKPEDPGLIFDSEIKIVYPSIPNNHGRPSRRLPGGGHYDG